MPLSTVMDPALAYTVPEVTELVGRSWGIAKNMLLAAEEEEKVEQKKIGRSVYWRYIGDDNTFGEEAEE